MASAELLFDTLRQLSETSSPSGQEGSLVELLTAQLAGRVDHWQVDALGNLFARRRASRAVRAPVLMLAAHMDEIGLIVSRIEGEFLRVDAVGGSDPATLLGREVWVQAEGEPLAGVIATLPPHLTDADARRKAPQLRDLVVDCGLPAASLQRRVRVGDRITLAQPLRKLLGERVAGKALDDRAGVLTVLEALRLLADRPLHVDVAAVFTVQEEVGLRGARTSAFALSPDVAIAVDVGFGDQPDVPERKRIRLGGGPSIGVGPSLHPGLRRRLTSLAQSLGIPHQVDVMPGANGTDAWAIAVARLAVPCAVLSVPLRHMHSTAEVLDLRDVRHTARLIAEFAADLDADTIEEWRHAAF